MQCLSVTLLEVCSFGGSFVLIEECLETFTFFNLTFMRIGNVVMIKPWWE